jgi:hypothetical protein
MRSPEVREHSRAHTLKCPSLRRMHKYRNLPYNVFMPGSISLVAIYARAESGAKFGTGSHRSHHPSIASRIVRDVLLGGGRGGDWQQNHHVVLDEGSPRG